MNLHKKATSKTWTRPLKNLDPENLEPWKSWTLKNLDPEKRGKRLDVEEWLEVHILLFINTENLPKKRFVSKPSEKVVIEVF